MQVIIQCENYHTSTEKDPDFNEHSRASFKYRDDTEHVVRNAVSTLQKLDKFCVCGGRPELSGDIPEGLDG